MTLTPYASASAGPCIPGNDGDSAGWVLTTRPSKRPRKSSLTSFMKPAEHDQVGLEAGHGVGQRAVPVVAVGEVAEPAHERRDAGPLGAGQPLDAVTVGADGDHPGAVRRVGAGVEQGLEVGAGAGDEDDEAGGRGDGTRAV